MERKVIGFLFYYKALKSNYNPEDVVYFEDLLFDLAYYYSYGVVWDDYIYKP